MADIELDNLGEDGKEEDAREEDTSFTENTNNGTQSLIPLFAIERAPCNNYVFVSLL